MKISKPSINLQINKTNYPPFQPAKNENASKILKVGLEVLPQSHNILVHPKYLPGLMPKAIKFVDFPCSSHREF